MVMMVSITMLRYIITSVPCNYVNITLLHCYVILSEASKDVENRDPEIQYNELTVRRYETSFSEDHIKKILGLKHRYNGG